ncbi:MAG: tRNA pseudouridine(55) synthase TruB [Anaerolineae bacterium]|nr:tRNA pseudouridine(55) synthase TruB [Anaerolineae bacterium]
MAFGLLNIHKPSGPTSHDIVARVRRGSGERRVGHAGTLDPLAEGVLVLALGQATRLVEYLSSSSKCYEARIELGLSTDTYDRQGQVVSQQPLSPELNIDRLNAALEHFRGEIDQVPPVYSAIKVKGKTAYARTRSGETVTLAPRRVIIHELNLLAFAPPHIDVLIRCSAGTYIRSLAHDLGDLLGCGAMLARLVRTESGIFKLGDAIAWDTLQAAFEADNWQHYLLPAGVALQDRPQVTVDEKAMERLKHGMPIDAPEGSDGLAGAYSSQDQLVAVLESDPSGSIWLPKKVFLSSEQS